MAIRATEFTGAADLAETLRYEAEIADGISKGLFDAAHDAADLIERYADRVNYLTNINEGLCETISEMRAGLVELREMCAPEKSA
jgi:hypothetical protein